MTDDTFANSAERELAAERSASEEACVKMIGQLKPYPSLKDSGVPWLGELPEHWRVLPNRFVFAEVKERDHPNADMLSVTIKSGVVRQKTLLEGSSKKDRSNHEKSAYKLVRPGDIAYNKMRAWQGAIGVSECEGIVSPAYVVERPRKDAAPRYLHYLLRTPAFAKEAERWSYGITSDMWSLRPEHFKMIYSSLPPLAEQAAIVRFLDHVDRPIQRYIRAKQKLTSLLDQQRQAIIHYAVTRGLGRDVRLKPSGLEWLGDLPENWKLRRFKFLAHVTSGQVDPREPLHRHKVLIAPNHIRSGTGALTCLETADAQGADSGKYEVRAGEIVYSKIRPNLRKAAIAPVDCLCSADMYPISVRSSEMRPRYLLLLLLSAPFTKFAVDCSLRVAMPKINRDALGECWLWYPDLEQQDRIVEHVEKAHAPYTRAITLAERQIAVLREYRTRLVADVVTGKFDVRDAAARLPDEVDEPDSLAESEGGADAGDLEEDETKEAPEPIEA